MEELIINENNIKDKIHTIRNHQVMLDRDLAELYGVKPIRLREQVKRNIDRFPDDFIFQLNEKEVDFMVSHFAIPSKQHLGGSLPYAFTEQGVSMFERFERIEQRLNIHDESFDKLFKALENKSLNPKQGIFYNGQIFDAYVFINDLFKLATNEIILIDNYIDETVFTIFSKYPNIKIKIYTANITKQLKLDFEKYKKQYNNIELLEFKSSHDRFLIIDKKEVYHIGASLKDLGKKWFAFSKFDIESLEILERLK